MTWDEELHYDTINRQLGFAHNVLVGSGDQPIGSLPAGHAFYGIGTLLPVRALSYLIDTTWFGQKSTFDNSFWLILHFAAFVCAVASSWYTGRLVYLVTGRREISVTAALALLVIPVWIGYGFFDYKDTPVAAGLIASVYYAATFTADRNSRTLGLFFVALLFLGAQKIAAIPLALPAAIGVAWVVIQERSLRLAAILLAQAATFLILLYLFTPPSWQEPVTFVLTNWRYMADYPYDWCTLTAGQCIGRGAGYSALEYLTLWYAVQLPVLLQIGVFFAIVLYVRSVRTANPPKHLIAASLIWPIAILVLMNSFLYDGIRHTLFLIPLAVSFVFVNIPERFGLEHRPLLAAYGVFLLIDTITLQPYGYVWFNEWARFFANETNYETDHWGYSLREAASLAKASQGSNEWIVGNPSHLIEPFVPERYSREIEAIPQGSSYLLVESIRLNKQPRSKCTIVSRVARRQLIAPQPLNLSFVARCPR